MNLVIRQLAMKPRTQVEQEYGREYLWRRNLKGVWTHHITITIERALWVKLSKLGSDIGKVKNFLAQKKTRVPVLRLAAQVSNAVSYQSDLSLA